MLYNYSDKCLSDFLGGVLLKKKLYKEVKEIAREQNSFYSVLGLS